MYINSIGKHDMVERIVHQIRSGAAPSAVGQRWLTTDVAASDRNVIVHIKFALSWMLHMYIIKSLTHIWPWVARLNQQCTLQRTKRDVNGWRNHTLFAMWSELMWKRSWSKLYLPNVRVDLFESGHNAGEKDSICAHEHPFNASPFAHAVHPFLHSVSIHNSWVCDLVIIQPWIDCAVCTMCVPLSHHITQSHATPTERRRRLCVEHQ